MQDACHCQAPVRQTDLIGGIAQRENADFASLGVAVRTEEREASLSRIHNHVFRKMPCPLLTSTATGPPADS
jgi:hypothetical protein